MTWLSVSKSSSRTKTWIGTSRSIPLSSPSDIPNHIMGFEVKARDDIHPNVPDQRLVDNAEDGNEILVLWLRNELGEYANIV